MDDGQEQEMAVGRLERGKRKLQRVMNKSVRRWMIVIYKQALVLIRQAFKMVTDLEKNGGDVVGNSNNYVIRDLIEKTRNWLVQQMGKKFPSLSADPPPPFVRAAHVFCDLLSHRRLQTHPRFRFLVRPSRFTLPQ